MRIGVVVPNYFPNPLYRAVLPMEELGRRGHVVGVASLEGDASALPSLDQLVGFDVVYFWQLHFDAVRRLAKALRRTSTAVIWDSDDDVTAVPKGSPNYRQAGGVRGRRMWSEMQAMVRLADAVTTPSEVLAQKFRDVGQAHVHVIENRLPAVYGARGVARRGSVVVGWVAGFEHVADARALDLATVVAQLLEARPEVEFETVGVALDVDHPRYRRHGVVDLPQLAGLIERFDIGVAPLADTPFGRSRSNIKVKEYAAHGIPWLASDFGPYRGLGEPEGGRLVADGGWLGALTALVDDRKARKRLGEAAHRWAKTQTIAANVGEWEPILTAAAGRARGRVAQAPV